MSLLPTGKFRHTCRAGDAFIEDTWSEQAQASEDLQKDWIRGGGLMSNARASRRCLMIESSLSSLTELDMGLELLHVVT